MHTTYTLERNRGVVGVGRQTTCTRSTGKEKRIASQSLSPVERKLTQEEVYKDLGGPIEQDAKIYTERTRCCAGGHPNTKDQDTSGEKKEVRVDENNQDADPWP